MRTKLLSPRACDAQCVGRTAMLGCAGAFIRQYHFPMSHADSAAWPSSRHLLVALASVVIHAQRGGAGACQTGTRLSGEAGALHGRAGDGSVLGAADRDQPDGHHPVRIREERGDGAGEQLRARRGGLEGQPPADRKPPGYPFDDTDLYKVLEGASLHAERQPDPKLDAYLDGLIAKIAPRRRQDGYLYTTRTIDPQHPHRWAGTTRWTLEKVDSHELYNLGHLYEAAVAHYQATGKRTLLDVALAHRRSARQHVRAGQAVDLARPPDHRDGPREALSRDRRRALPDAREVHARRARARRQPSEQRRGTYNQSHGRWSSRPRPSATRCAPPTCTRAWRTSPR